jgi:hypothetical protein
MDPTQKRRCKEKEEEDGENGVGLCRSKPCSNFEFVVVNKKTHPRVGGSVVVRSCLREEIVWRTVGFCFMGPGASSSEA